MRGFYVDPDRLRQARLALEEAGYEVETHLALLEGGGLMAVRDPKTGNGWILDAYEVNLVATYGADWTRGKARRFVGLAGSPDEPGYWFRCYVERALANIVMDFQSEAAPGNRNNALNRMAYRLGRLVGGGLISEEEAREILFGEADRVFSPKERHEVEATARSGLEAGQRKPAPRPERMAGLKARKGVVPPWAK